jgi:hypothetical protein
VKENWDMTKSIPETNELQEEPGRDYPVRIRLPSMATYYPLFSPSGK